MRLSILFILLGILMISSSWCNKKNNIPSILPERVPSNIYLDTFSPGNITINQLRTTKGVKINAILKNGKIQPLIIYSFSLNFNLAKSRNGVTHLFVEINGDKFSPEALALLSQSKDGDYIMIGNIQTEIKEGIKIDPFPMWKVISNE